MNHDRRTPTPLLRPHFATSFRNGCSVGSMKTTNLALGIAALALVEARRAWRAESLADTGGVSRLQVVGLVQPLLARP